MVKNDKWGKNVNLKDLYPKIKPGEGYFVCSSCGHEITQGMIWDMVPNPDDRTKADKITCIVCVGPDLDDRHVIEDKT